MTTNPSTEGQSVATTAANAGAEVTRRRVIGAAAGSLAAASGLAAVTSPSRAAPRRRRQGYPFTLGVASGDPLPTAVVLWTRLAVDPTNGGGMPPDPLPVQWRVATDEAMTNVVREGTAPAHPDGAHSVHVDVDGLQPGADYFYQFKQASHLSAVGHTRTAPTVGSQLSSLRVAHASCQNYTAGFFTAHPHLAAEDLDLVIWLGDYIYDTPGRPIAGREHDPPYSIRTLADFRARHTQYKLDPDLQEAHRAHPWVITLDDHDVINDYASFTVGGHPEMTPEDVAAIRTTAFRTAYEHLPIRRRPEGAYYRLYRGYEYGDLVSMNVLDNRQFRTFREPACSPDERDEHGWCPADLDPERTTLGSEQTDWLLGRLTESQALWNVLANPTVFAQRDRDKDPEQTEFNRDAVLERQRILDAVIEAGLGNVVVLSGDSHRSSVYDVPPRYDGPLDAAPVATEFDGTSITSGGDRSPDGHYNDDPQNNPHRLYFDLTHGYTVSTFTRDEMTAEFKAVGTVESPSAGLRSMCTWRVDHGQPGAHLVNGGP